nr:Toll/interleukin-1 receptor (TIR) domain-containing protein [Tanacetum cinerariifolium]
MVELCMPAECPKLAYLDLRNNAKLRALDVGLTLNLEMVAVENCTQMVKLYMPAECPKLVTLYLDNLKLRTLHLGMIPNIKWLRFNDCRDLVELWTLHIPAECPKLAALDLRNCVQLEELPEEIGRLECLEVLYMTGTGISRLLESTFRVKGLRIVGSRRLLESYGFTPEIEISYDETYYYIDIKP